MYATYKIDVNEICRQDYTNDERFLKLQKSDQDLFKSTFQSLYGGDSSSRRYTKKLVSSTK